MVGHNPLSAVGARREVGQELRDHVGLLDKKPGPQLHAGPVTVEQAFPSPLDKQEQAPGGSAFHDMDR